MSKRHILELFLDSRTHVEPLGMPEDRMELLRRDAQARVVDM